MGNDRFEIRINDADEVLRSKCIDSAKTLYSENLPVTVENRLNSELSSIMSNQYSSDMLIAHDIAQCSIDRGFRVTTRGMIGSLFTAYLLDITEINPLPMHYRCAKCRHYEDIKGCSDFKAGIDLPEKICPVCGETMVGDGFNIYAEMCMGIGLTRRPQVIINLASRVVPDVIDMLKKKYGEGNVIGAGVAVVDENGSMKRGTHPGGIFIVPEGVDITGISDLRIDKRDDGLQLQFTEKNYKEVEKLLVKYDILAKPDLEQLHDLELKTGYVLDDVALKEDSASTTFTDAVRTEGLLCADFRGENDREKTENQKTAGRMGITCRDDILDYLISNKCDFETAFHIMKHVSTGRSLTPGMEHTMSDLNISSEYIDICKKIRYLYPRAMTAAYAAVTWRKQFYSSRFPTEYNRVFADV